MTIGVDSTSTSRGWVGLSESSSDHSLCPGEKPQWRKRSSCEADMWHCSVIKANGSSIFGVWNQNLDVLLSWQVGNPRLGSGIGPLD